MNKKPIMKFYTVQNIVVTSILFGVSANAKAAISTPSGPAILERLAPSHPRLLLSKNEFARLKQRLQNDATAQGWYQKITDEADGILEQSPSQYEIPDGKRLLATSRRVLNRVYTLALVYRMTDDDRYLNRCWTELRTASGFKDWNPSHFLDTAEMTHAFAIGYDWLFAHWSDEQKAILRDAIIEKGLKPGVWSLRGEKSYGWWRNAHHNWNQVCNGGIGMGALALGDEVPDLAGEFLEMALKSIQLPMEQFAPDGAWREGPGYWNYATAYNVVFLAALRSALKTDFGLSDIEGFSEAGMFPIYMTGPLGRTFNYADGGDRTIRAPQMFWLAQRFQRPAYAKYQARVASPDPLDLVWYRPELVRENSNPLPLNKYFRGAEVVTLRSNWNDPKAIFLGFKGGDNKANHSNLDLGSFVFDALGHRWAVDLGSDNYNLPGYFGNQRWTYYRMRAEGHNTLVLNPGERPGQRPSAEAKIVRFNDAPDKAFAIADLTAAYEPEAQNVRRGIALRDRNRILIQDEVKTGDDAELWWFMHTPATIELQGASALLSLGSDKLEARILAPAGAEFMTLDAKPLPGSPNPEGQAANQGIRKLAIHLEGVRDLRLLVQFIPLTAGENNPPQPNEPLKALADW